MYRTHEQASNWTLSLGTALEGANASRKHCILQLCTSGVQLYIALHLCAELLSGLIDDGRIAPGGCRLDSTYCTRPDCRDVGDRLSCTG